MNVMTLDELAEQIIVEQQNLISFLTMLTGDRTVADDLFQETYLELDRLRNKFEKGTNFSAWARSIARFQALRYIRKRQKDHISLSPEVIDKLADTWEVMSFKKEENSRELALKHCIDDLQQHHQDVLNWRYQKKYSHKSIAEKLDRSIGSVKVLVSRLHKKLRYCVESKLIDPDFGLDREEDHHA